MGSARQDYHARMQRVLDHVDRHLDGDLDLETLSRVAAFSRFHFHRQFAATFGVSLDRYVRLTRLKRASYRLAFRDGARVTDVALEAGYEAPDAFARAFRRTFGQAPSEFRKSPDWAPWSSAFAPLSRIRIQIMPAFSPDQVAIVDVPPVPVALMEHRGDPATIGETIRRFIAWRKSVGLRPAISATYTIFHDNPETVTPEDFRMDLCAATDRPIAPNAAGVEAGLIPAGRCARLDVIGDDLTAAALYLYRDWLPESGERPRDFPLYCQRIAFFPDVPEHEAVNALFLPLD